MMCPFSSNHIDIGHQVNGTELPFVQQLGLLKFLKNSTAHSLETSLSTYEMQIHTKIIYFQVEERSYYSFLFSRNEPSFFSIEIEYLST